MLEIVFVILHYMTLDDTIECVESIRDNCGKEKYKIVIVDNASPNASGRELQKQYAKSKDIDYFQVLKERKGMVGFYII